eukprot:TRINITY_DN29593_c0_g1_i1.p1 TRINITY_DN29593_c0_g1~~TRINITY_DN29593_c0_g1_i1.p1  ORF type:complete len:326 (+),score=74.18 TRINITY_DN29593_c0_g1_i1:266-1243(+)
MPEKRKWQAKSNQQSFDNPEKEKTTNGKTRTPSPNRILSILGKNIGLLSRKHSRERQKKKYEEETQKKNKIQASSRKSSENSNFGNILRFSKSKSNQINAVTKPTENQKNIVKDQGKHVKAPNSSVSPKKLISAPKPNISSSNPKQQKVSRAVTSVTITKSNNSAQNIEPKTNIKQNSYKQNIQPKSSSAKPLIAQKINSTKLKKSKSDSALNETQGKTLRASSAQSNVSRTSSSITSRSSSKSSTPSLKKKRKKAPVQKKKSVDSSDSSETQQAVVYTNYRHQNRRLVTMRQRQELYSLNLMMTALEKENFIRVCHEKGYIMDA